MLRIRPGLNPQTLVPEASMLTTRPPNSTLVSFMQVFDDRIQAESGWNYSSILTLLGSGHQKPA